MGVRQSDAHPWTKSAWPAQSVGPLPEHGSHTAQKTIGPSIDRSGACTVAANHDLKSCRVGLSDDHQTHKHATSTQTQAHTHLTSPHLTSHRLASPHITSPHLTSPHLTSPHLTSPHLTSPHLTSPHLTSPHLTRATDQKKKKTRTRQRGQVSRRQHASSARSVEIV